MEKERLFTLHCPSHNESQSLLRMIYRNIIARVMPSQDNWIRHLSCLSMEVILYRPGVQCITRYLRE